ncbi:MAG: sigma-54-dependent Fis family transcriptional regulator, partial [Deltaproteobacteria bacterium]|nr:sigma-54-dependent Fis family transcriptional regulator [Deltaproteobacteria bacterium]
MSRELDVTGMTIQSLFSAVGLHGGDELSSSKTPPEVATEIVLTRNGSDEEFRLEYLTRNLPGDTEPGRLLLLKDVSRQRDMEERLELHERMAQLLSRETLASQATASGMGEVPFPMIGESNVMKHIFTLVDRVARSDASVLITGESGTGKEIIARTIHDRGPRKGRPFVALNCGAIPENLIESELFGHKKGSFTGAVNDSPGLFRQAHTGTIFLDEVGELPLPMQTKLLRVLQERKVRSVGDVHDIAIDVRIVAATNRDLKKEIARGGFREDLYYRLNVVHIIVPPLRDRREDIPLFVRHFVNACCGHDGVLPRLSPEAVQML